MNIGTKSSVSRMCYKNDMQTGSKGNKKTGLFIFLLFSKLFFFIFLCWQSASIPNSASCLLYPKQLGNSKIFFTIGKTKHILKLCII
jgi:hypothetical protein